MALLDRDVAVVVGIEEECVKDGEERRVPDRRQKRLAELELFGKLLEKLPHAIEEEQQQRAALIRVAVGDVAQAVAEGMPHGHPILLDERLEADDCAEVRIEQSLDQARNDATHVAAVVLLQRNGLAFLHFLRGLIGVFDAKRNVEQPARFVQQTVEVSVLLLKNSLD